MFIGLLTIVGWTGYTNISKWIRNYVSSRSDEHIRNNEAVLQERVDELFNKKIDILSDVAIGINEFFSGIYRQPTAHWNSVTRMELTLH